MANVFLLAQKLRKKNPKMKWQTAVKEAGKQQRKVGAYKVIEKGEKKSTPAKKTVQVVRSKEGTFQGYKKVAGIDPIDLLRIDNDVNGNPRYVFHYTTLLNDEEKSFLPFSKMYEYAVKKAKLIGGKKYHNKKYGGGIVVQSYNIDDTKRQIFKVRNSTPKIKY